MVGEGDMSYLQVILEDNLNAHVTHQRVDDAPFRLKELLRETVGYEFRFNQPFTTAEEYAELHIEEAIIQLHYAVLALENR